MKHGVGLGAMSQHRRSPTGATQGGLCAPPDPVMAPVPGHASDTSLPATPLLPTALRLQSRPATFMLVTSTLEQFPAPVPHGTCLLPSRRPPPLPPPPNLALGGVFNASGTAEEAKGESSKPAACAAEQTARPAVYKALLLSPKARERQKSVTCPVPLSAG